jgi:hypothetical protein
MPCTGMLRKALEDFNRGVKKMQRYIARFSLELCRLCGLRVLF